MSLIKNYINYIKEIISGEQYLSDKDKFALMLHLCALAHLGSAVIFLCFGSILLMLYNLLSFLVFESLVTASKNKLFKLVVVIASMEVVVFVTLTTLGFGHLLNYNLFCFLMIPAAFYVCNSIKDFKHPFAISCGVTVLSIGTYIFSVLYKTESGVKLVTMHPVLTNVSHIINISITMIFLALICFMFTVEMRNSTAALENRNNQLKKLSTIDPLTKLANRRSMSEKLNIAMHLLKKDKKPFSVILGDIDDFKKVNDTYGHDCGDKVLIMVANTISSQMRDGDFVCRWGGEEILILVNGNLEAAKSLGDRILNKIRESEVVHEGRSVKVTMTFGVCEVNESLRIEDFIQKADSRLYYGKSHGKNQVVSSITVN